MFKRLIKISIVVILLIGILAAIGGQRIFGSNTLHSEAKEVYIPTGSTLDDVSRILSDQEIIKNNSSFEWVAGLMKYESKVKPGKYKIVPDLSNRELISQLRLGAQEPVKITISTARKIADVAGDVADKIEADSLTIIGALLAPSFLSEHNLTEESVISVIIPNTYEAYWTLSAEEFAERMAKEHRKFWAQKNRLSAAEKLGMTKQEVATLASIVEKESIQGEERPIIAGLYLNRLKQNIPLQADPTVVYGVGDFTIRRVLNKHLAHQSPYNTYLNNGLPPGPICMPSISSIDAVLDADQHDYLFMCAKPGYNGSHSFAITNAEHERNAGVYRRWLNSQGIKG